MTCLIYYVPQTEVGGEGHCFWCGSRQHLRPNSLFLLRYILNQWVDFDQTVIDIWLGGGGGGGTVIDTKS